MASPCPLFRRLAGNNFSSFPDIWECQRLLFLLKAIFISYRSLDWQFFQSLKNTVCSVSEAVPWARLFHSGFSAGLTSNTFPIGFHFQRLSIHVFVPSFGGLFFLLFTSPVKSIDVSFANSGTFSHFFFKCYLSLVSSSGTPTPALESLLLSLRSHLFVGIVFVFFRTFFFLCCSGR